jgi:hypothetical protein
MRWTNSPILLWGRQLRNLACEDKLKTSCLSLFRFRCVFPGDMDNNMLYYDYVCVPKEAVDYPFGAAVMLD